MAIFAAQPFKALYVLAALGVNALRVPLWMIYFLPRGLRQHKDWTYKQAILVRIVRSFLYTVATIEIRIPTPLLPGAEKDQFTICEVASPSYYAGALNADSEILPQRIGGTWYPRAPTPGTTGLVVLHFHGGAYVIGDGRTKDAGFAAKTLIAELGATAVFAPQYRLASQADRRAKFPAALQDAVSAYVHLTKTLRIPASSIVVGGDSAGANLTLGLLAYLEEHGDAIGLERPAAALLWSAWVSPRNVSLGKANFESVPNGSSDYIGDRFGRWGARCLEPSAASGLTLAHPYIDFLGENPIAAKGKDGQGGGFATKVPLWFSSGSAEALLYDITRSVESFKKIPGNTVVMDVQPHCPHDVILVGAMVGFEKEAIEATRRARAFLKAENVV